MVDADDPKVEIDPKSGAARIETDDGGIIVALGGLTKDDPNPQFEENLAEKLSDEELNTIGSDLMEGIEADLQSRSDWESNLSDMMAQLGLHKESRSSLDLDTVSKVRHPILLEALLNFWAQSIAEFLPAEGPVKVIYDALNSTVDVIADCERLEKDFNHYLTDVATEYYPDSSRASLHVGLAGGVVKKVYADPIRERPVSEAVYLQDFIVSADITDIANASRVSHRIRYLPNDVKKMQSAKVWRKVELGTPSQGASSTEKDIGRIEGVNKDAIVDRDRQFTFYESITDLIIESDKFSKNATKEGFASPYLVTVEAESKTVVSIRRFWEEGDKRFKREEMYVPDFYCPGLGWYPIGLGQMLSNSAASLTALWRQMMDGGMAANFPGFLYLDTLGRQDKSRFMVKPGEGAPIKAPQGMAIQNVVMPVPTKDISPTLLGLTKEIEEGARALAQAGNIPVGEGQGDVPVGTIVAMIEQATKVLLAIHKGRHMAQKKEFQLLKKLFARDPEALTRFDDDPTKQAWTTEELQNADISPRSDPNVPSHIHRLMLCMMIKQLAQQNPTLYNIRAVDEFVLKIAGLSMPDQLFAPPQPPMPAPVDPMVQAKMADIAMKKEDTQRKAASEAAQAQQNAQTLQAKLASEKADRESKERIAQMNNELAEKRIMADIAKTHMTSQTQLTQAGLMQEGADKRIKADIVKAHMGNQTQIHTQHLSLAAAANKPQPSGENQ